MAKIYELKDSGYIIEYTIIFEHINKQNVLIGVLTSQQEYICSHAINISKGSSRVGKYFTNKTDLIDAIENEIFYHECTVKRLKTQRSDLEKINSL